jgi:osmotically-inducible protein OsmY
MDWLNGMSNQGGNIMRIGRGLTTCGIAGVCLLLAGPAGAQERKEEGFQERLGRAIGEFKETTKDLRHQVREGFESVRDSIDRMSTEGRVYARLRWDKALSDATISVDVDKDGVTVLRGTVPSESAKRRAEQLAVDTIGVERVTNELKVVPPQSRP